MLSCIASVGHWHAISARLSDVDFAITAAFLINDATIAKQCRARSHTLIKNANLIPRDFLAMLFCLFCKSRVLTERAENVSPL